MVLKLDPRYPLAWRSPTSMQLGFTRDPLVIDDVTPAAERIIAALVAGVSRTGLDMIGRQAGAGSDEVQRLLDLVEPALERAPTETLPPVTLLGEGATADAIAGLLAAAGHAVDRPRDAGRAPGAGVAGDGLGPARAGRDGLGVIVAGYAVRPDVARAWLRSDRPHLAVVLGDEGAAVGPLVVPGRTACLLCLAHHATDADPAWPALATQLHGRVSTADTQLLAAQVAVVVGRVVREFPDGMGEVLAIEPTGISGARPLPPHPLCGCHGLPVA